MSLLESIRSNDIIHLHLRDSIDDIFVVGDGSDSTTTSSTRRTRRRSFASAIGEFLVALERNTSIESMHLEKDFMADLRQEYRERLLYALGRVKSLRELTIADSLLQIRHLSLMIQDSKSLRYLCLQNIVLQGVKSDFDECEEIIHGHDCTKTDLELVNCMAAISNLSLQGLSKDKSGGTRRQTALVTNATFGEGEMNATANTVRA